MAIQGGLPVGHDFVFPNCAYLVGEVTALEDYETAKAARESGRQVDTQARDKVTGLRVWAARVIDADEMARKGQAEVTVKIVAEVQPVPPPLLAGTPFRPVEFENLTATAWIDDSRERARIAWSLKATGMRAPSKTAGRATPVGDGKAA